MEREIAEKIRMGKINPFDAGAQLRDLFQITLGGYLDNDGDIRCIECDRLNECCECED